MRNVARVSLRTRLIAAFVALIVTSASATIVIGGVIFARRLLQLINSRMEVGLRVAELNLVSHLERFELLARATNDRITTRTAPVELCGMGWVSEPVLDAVFLMTPGRVVGSHFARVSDSAASRPTQGSTAPLLTGGGAVAPKARACVPFAPIARPVVPPTLAGFVDKARREQQTLSGLMVLEAAELRQLGFHPPPEQVLLLAAATPLPDRGILLLLAIANRRSALVSPTVTALGTEGKQAYAASIFLRDVRITTTLDQGLGTPVDREVVKKVLEKGEFYSGSAIVVNQRYFTAYRPLRDYQRNPIGILGIGVKQELFAGIRNQTIGLFAALIGLGMLFGFAMTYWFTGWLIRPIRELAKGMDRVAGGDLGHKVRITATDELGKLAKAFNLMVRNMQERDIRLREMTEERLSQVEKQISIGRVAAGVAHEINNPLTTVLSLSILTMKSLPEEDQRRGDMELVVQETTRCRDIVRHLLDFARERPPEMQVVDLHQVLRDTLVLTSKYEGMDRIRIVQQLASLPLFVHGDPKQLQQVFTNLITNAAEAIVGAGSITITTDEDSSGSFVVTRISDTGKGIPKENIQRIFEPFFTTKGTSKGTGLGLSVSLGIVRKHSGSVDVESEEGRGTTVTVLLPRAPSTEGAT